MSRFDCLHPALQHHIVNSLGWRSLRPLQEAAIEPVLAGENALLLAPTAGGKTEAAVFPLLSRMLGTPWHGLSVLYVCPIKALLNNLETRLHHYLGLVGRNVEVWHGDIPDSRKRKVAAAPPDLLLATPESLEVMLVSRRIDHHAFFAGLRAVVVDEVHAFAGDDRGWHLLSVVERLQHLAGQPIQRLGLSATIGNPEDLLDWLSGSSDAPRRVVSPPAEAGAEVEVQLDYVGSLPNAAVVISRLHRGEKRLVFCDSRARVEALAAELRKLGVRTFVSHSSLSVAQRRDAEAAFAASGDGADAVIVATSTLELGIDVGELDRVIQIDAPGTVASFLQRVGRTGRRVGTQRNCLFLATSEAALLRCCALLRLWESGYVEPVTPPPLPFHILAQQIMALALQEGGIGREDWRRWIGAMPGFAAIEREDQEAIVRYMLDQGILHQDQGILSMGRSGEAAFGHRHFMELFSVFTSPPVFTVLHGRSEVGQVHSISFQRAGNEPAVLTLGGRDWLVTHVDWSRRQAYVEPSADRGRSRWLGHGPGMSGRMARAVAATLADSRLAPWLSRRAREALQDAREAHDWARTEATVILRDAEGRRGWWTFAGRSANALLAGALTESGWPASGEDYQVRFAHGPAEPGLHDLEAVLANAVSGAAPSADDDQVDALKFLQCLPRALAVQMLQRRDPALADLHAVVNLPIVTVAG